MVDGHAYKKQDKSFAQLLIAIYLLLIPLWNLLIYYFKIPIIKDHINKFYIASLLILLLLLTVEANLKKASISRTNFLVVLVILFYPFLVSVFNISNISFKPFFSHFIGALIFVTSFALGCGGLVDLKKLMESQRFQNTLMVFTSITLFFFLINPFDYSYYKSMQSYFLVPSYVYFLHRKEYGKTTFFGVLIFLHFKRAVILFSLFFLLIHVLRNFKISTKGIKLVFFAILFSLVTYALMPSEYHQVIDNRIGQGVETVSKLFSDNESKEIDSSSNEKLVEIKSSRDQLFNSIMAIVFGNGFGWQYIMEGTNNLRYYTHVTPWYLILTYGSISIFLFISVFYKILTNFLRGKEKFENKLAFFFILLSLSTMDYFVAFLPAITLGTIYRYRKKNEVVEIN